jgi:hypothetical protein
MVQNSLAREVTEVKQNIDDVLACKLNKTFFGLDCDIFIVKSYIKPAYTSSKYSENFGLATTHLHRS